MNEQSWTDGQSRPLTVAQPRPTWISRELLAACAALTEQLTITGEQTFLSREPADHESNYLCFKVTLRTPGSEGVAFGYVLDDTHPYAHRASSIAEALAELAHGGAFGDVVMGTALVRLVGQERASEITEMAARHP